jgi:hypothetical protein
VEVLLDGDVIEEGIGEPGKDFIREGKTCEKYSTNTTNTQKKVKYEGN